MKDATCFTDLDLIAEVCYGAQNSLADLNTKDSWESLGQQGNETSNPKGIQPWIFTGRIAAEAPILWLPDMMSWLIGKDPDAGKDWRQEKGTTEDEMVGWHHRLNGHEFEQAPGDGDGQGSLVCCSPWGHEESDTTEQLNNNGAQEKVTTGYPQLTSKCYELPTPPHALNFPCSMTRTLPPPTSILARLLRSSLLLPSYWQQAFSVAQMVKNLPATRETQVQSLGQEDPLEKGMATHS